MTLNKGIILSTFQNALALIKSYIDSTVQVLSSSILDLESGKAEKWTITASTLSAGGWSNAQYSFESSYPVATYDLEIEPNGDSCTSEQLEAWNGAQITGSASANKIKAFGDVPTIDIPVILQITKK